MRLSRRRIAELADRVGLSRLRLRLRALRELPWLTIVNYHRVEALSAPAVAPFDEEIVDATPEAFEDQLAVMARYFEFITLADLRAALDGGPLPRNPAMITFDDGYLSCHAQALPALRRRGIRAAFFIATDAVTHRRLFWWDRISWLVKNARRPSFSLAYPFEVHVDLAEGTVAPARRLTRIAKEHFGLDLERFLDELTEATGAEWSESREREMAARIVMTWDHVRDLHRAGMDIGSHTRTHRVLQTLPPALLERELRGSREDVEREIGERVFALAYPDGRGVAADSPIRRAIAEAGYDVGFTYNIGIQRRRGFDRFGVGRVSVEPTVSANAFRGTLAFPALRA